VVEIVDDGKGIDPARIRAKALEKGIAGADALASMSDHEVIQLILPRISPLPIRFQIFPAVVWGWMRCRPWLTTSTAP